MFNRKYRPYISNYRPYIIAGTAVIAGGLIGAVTAYTRRMQKVDRWSDQAMRAANYMLNKSEAVSKGKILGGIAGTLLGAAVALLLTPKTGSDLIYGITHPLAVKRAISKKVKSLAKSKKVASLKRKVVKKAKSLAKPKKTARRGVHKSLYEHISEAAKVS